MFTYSWFYRTWHMALQMKILLNVLTQRNLIPFRAIVYALRNQSVAGHRSHCARQSSIFLVIRIHIPVMSDRCEFLLVALMAQLDLFANQMRSHHYREYRDSLSRKCFPCASLDAMAFGHNAVVKRWNDVPPVGIHTCVAINCDLNINYTFKLPQNVPIDKTPASCFLNWVV